MSLSPSVLRDLWRERGADKGCPGCGGGLRTWGVIVWCPSCGWRQSLDSLWTEFIDEIVSVLEPFASWSEIVSTDAQDNDVLLWQSMEGQKLYTQDAPVTVTRRDFRRAAELVAKLREG